MLFQVLNNDSFFRFLIGLSICVLFGVLSSFDHCCCLSNALLWRDYLQMWLTNIHAVLYHMGALRTVWMTEMKCKRLLWKITTDEHQTEPTFWSKYSLLFKMKMCYGYQIIYTHTHTHSKCSYHQNCCAIDTISLPNRFLHWDSIYFFLTRK